VEVNKGLSMGGTAGMRGQGCQAKIENPLSAHVLVQCSCADMLNAICLGKSTFPFFVILLFALLRL
jgi:hypothetical protein